MFTSLVREPGYHATAQAPMLECPGIEISAPKLERFLSGLTGEKRANPKVKQDERHYPQSRGD
jgi:hypothetical protein